MDLQTYALIKLAHVLLFVYWLGADIGVFYSASVVREHALGIEARRTALRILGWIDQIPRYCLVLMLPVGYMLAMQLGVAEVPLAVRVGLWVIAVVWLWAVWLVHHRKGTALAERVRRIDRDMHPDDPLQRDATNQVLARTGNAGVGRPVRRGPARAVQFRHRSRQEIGRVCCRPRGDRDGLVVRRREDECAPDRQQQDDKRRDHHLLDQVVATQRTCPGNVRVGCDRIQIGRAHV